jgi:hypothetical protein
MKELVDNPVKRFSQDEMDRITAQSRSRATGMQEDKGNGFMFDDSSDVSFSDEVHEVSKSFSKARLLCNSTELDFVADLY